jgi:transitional endoplasmic reticulum ATPase
VNTVKFSFLKTVKATKENFAKRVAFFNPEDFQTLGLSPGCMVYLEGKRYTISRAYPSPSIEHEKISIDGFTRENAVVGLDERIKVQRIDMVRPASYVILEPHRGTRLDFKEHDVDAVKGYLMGWPIATGETVPVPWRPPEEFWSSELGKKYPQDKSLMTTGLLALPLHVHSVVPFVPPGPVVICEDTEITVYNYYH